MLEYRPPVQRQPPQAVAFQRRTDHFQRATNGNVLNGISVAHRQRVIRRPKLAHSIAQVVGLGKRTVVEVLNPSTPCAFRFLERLRVGQIDQPRIGQERHHRQREIFSLRTIQHGRILDKKRGFRAGQCKMSRTQRGQPGVGGQLQKRQTHAAACGLGKRRKSRHHKPSYQNHLLPRIFSQALHIR